MSYKQIEKLYFPISIRTQAQGQSMTKRNAGNSTKIQCLKLFSYCQQTKVGRLAIPLHPLALSLGRSIMTMRNGQMFGEMVRFLTIFPSRNFTDNAKQTRAESRTTYTGPREKFVEHRKRAKNWAFRVCGSAVHFQKLFPLHSSYNKLFLIQAY